MRAAFSITVLLLLSNLSGAQTCSSFNSKSFLPDVTLTGNGGHFSGQHGVATGSGTLISGVQSTNTNIQGSCTYSAGSNGFCATAASVNLVGNTTIVERGQLSSPGSHNVNLGWASGSAGSGGGSATATGSFGGGACSTSFGNCSVGVSVGIGTIQLSISGGQTIWQEQTNVPYNCPAVNPTGGGGGGGTGCNSVPLAGSDPNGVIVECNPGTSPIIVDTEGEGFHLTSAETGVAFDIRGNGHPVEIAWTDAQFHNAFLALPGADGLVHNGQ